MFSERSEQSCYPKGCLSCKNSVVAWLWHRTSLIPCDLVPFWIFSRFVFFSKSKFSKNVFFKKKLFFCSNFFLMKNIYENFIRVDFHGNSPIHQKTAAVYRSKPTWNAGTPDFYNAPFIYEDGDLRLRLRGGTTDLNRCRFLVSFRINIEFCTLEDLVKGFHFHQKISKTVHGDRRYSFSKLGTMQISWFSMIAIWQRVI